MFDKIWSVTPAGIRAGANWIDSKEIPMSETITPNEMAGIAAAAGMVLICGRSFSFRLRFDECWSC